ncbi:apolipoprotein N-acyltransferase [Nocardioides sp. URHA0020]|uniref:apolipoprotein N-acyltransferase n=1 Tax=Nocardioides sp. URHA0020 TaxID=1380392 RepID=UPI00068524F6|nr:apolipoprotein N-acyltransferase [Nocardioides sp. URHA0020]
MLVRILAAVACGVGLALAFEPVAQPVVIPFAVAGFVLCTRGLTLRWAWLPGLAFGLGFELVLLFWMRAVGPDAWIGLSIWQSTYFAVLGVAVAALQRHRLWPLWVATAWVSAEMWFSTWPFSGMPWGRLAFAVADTPLADALPWVGTIGVSLVLALSGSLLAWVVVSEGRERGVAGGVLAGLVLLSLVPLVAPWQPDTDGQATVAVVQGDVPGNGDDILYDYRQVTQNQVDVTVRLADDVANGREPRPDFVVWPENSTAVDPFRDQQTHAGILTASQAIGVPILVGAIVDAGPRHVLNQGIVWDPVTGAGDRYTKHHPVVFGEYIPFRDYLDDLQIGRLTMVGRDMVAGTRLEPLSIGDVEVADSICFDVAYDDGIYGQVRNGAQLLTVQTSNATFIHTDQIDQQFAITRLRAIETGRWLAVASTNGVSGIISPDGQVVARADPRTQAALVERVGLDTAITPAVRIGAWSGRLCLLLTILGLALALFPYGLTRARQQAGDATVPSGLAGAHGSSSE